MSLAATHDWFVLKPIHLIINRIFIILVQHQLLVLNQYQAARSRGMSSCLSCC